MLYTELMLVLESWVVRREIADDDSCPSNSCMFVSRGSER
jgi:hypothetical protein